MNEVLAQYRIQVLRTREEIEVLREFWNSCNPARDADIDFYLFIVDLFPEVRRPHVVVLYHGDVPQALLAGRLEERRVPVRFGYIAAPLPQITILQFVHGGCLGNVSDASAELLVRSIIDSLAAGEADAAILEQLDLASPLVRCATHLPRWFCSDHVINPEVHWMRDLSGETGPFLARISRNARYQQKNTAGKLAKDFHSNRIENFNTPDALARLIRDAESVARKSYQRGLGVGFSATPIICARLEFEARKGSLRAYVLYLDDQPCAFWIGSLHNRVFVSDYLAFDPAYTSYRPGLYLIVKVMEELCEESNQGKNSVERIDFGSGDASYKERLSNRHCEVTRIYIFAPRPKPIWINFARAAVGAMNRSAKGLVRMTPLLQGIKRTWRRRVTESG